MKLLRLLVALAGCGSLAPLAARAQVPLATALDWTNVWNTGYLGDVWQYNPWFGQTLTNHDRVDAAQSGHIGATMTNWIQTSATGPGVLTFWWKVSSEANYDKLRFALNGVEKTNISGYTLTNWFPQAFDLPAGANTLRWSYSKDRSGDAGYDAGWVDQVAFTPGVTMAGAADNPDLTWTVGGDGIWFPQTNVFHFGGDALQSGAIGDSQTNWIQTTANGPTFMRFWWKVSSETNRDALEIFRDSVLQAGISGEVDWEERSVFVPAGSHVFQWRYSKNARTVGGHDAGWLDAVEFYLPEAPFIGTQPTNQIVWAGQRATFSVLALGAEPLTNQWRFNGANLPGQTNSTLMLPPVGPSDEGAYSVVVSNRFGYAISSNATLTVLTGPSFTEALDAPPELNWTSGGDAPWFTETNTTRDLVDAAQSGAILSGQQSWLQAGVTLTNPAWLYFWWTADAGWQDKLSLEVNGANVVNIGGWNPWGHYYPIPLRAGTNVLRWVYSKASSYDWDAVWLDQVSLTNILAPVVLAPPQSRVVLEGTPVTLAVDALGAAPLNFQWAANNVALAGATNATLPLGNATPNQSAAYSVTVSNASGFTNLTATLTVVPFQDYTGALESGPLVWDNSCAEWPWFVQTTNTHDGVDAAQSGPLPDSQTNWLQTSVSGPGQISFWWRVSSQTNYDKLSFALDGVARTNLSGEVGWNLLAYDVWPGPNHTLTWAYSKNASLGSGMDAAFLDQVHYAPGLPLYEALDETNRLWTAGGSAPWFLQTSVTHDGTDAAQSGTAADGEANWIQTTFHGPGAVSFWWKVSSQTNGDTLSFAMNGAVRTNVSGEVAWQRQVFYVPYGLQTLRWTYAKDSSAASGLDAAWLDEVQITTNLDAITFPPEDHLVAWYPFNGNARDESGHGNHGTLYGPPTPTYDRSYFGGSNAYTFGTGSYVDCGNRPLLNNLTNFTVTAWIRPSSVAWQNIISKHTSDGSGNCYSEFNLYLYGDGTLVTFLGDGGASGNCSFPETLVYNGNVGKLTADYQWHHVALTVGNTKASLYLDGAYVPPVSGSHDTVVPSHRQYGTRPLQIGRFNNGSVGYFSGRIDEVRVYNAVLSPEQILTAMDADVLPPRLIAAPLSLTTNQCADLVLSGYALGASSLRYQWFKDSVALDGETNATLALSALSPADAGDYSVVVTNRLGSVTGLVAQVTIVPLGVDAPWLSWNSGGVADWFGQTNVTRDGFAAQSGRITNNQSTWIETAVSGPGTLRYWWKVSSEAGYDGLTNQLDGVVQAGISGEVDWQQRTLAIPAGYHVVGWTYSKDNVDLDPVGQDAGWLDEVEFTPDMPVPLAEALDNTNSWSVLGAGSWFGQTNLTHDRVDAARSGSITNEEKSILQTTVNGPGVLRFWWKVSSEEDYDLLSFFTDGADGDAISGEVDWQEHVSFIPAGTHTLAWIYSKDDSISEGADAGWVDQVSFLPTAGPWVLSQPRDQPTMLGDLAQFDVSVLGVEPLAYQWRHENSPLPNETNAWLRIQPVNNEDAGSYSVRIVNPSNTTDSASAALTFLPLKLEWQRGYGGSDSEEPWAMLQTSDGGFLVGGYSVSTNGDRTGPTFGEADFWAVRLDAAGSVLWNRSYGGTNDDLLQALAPASGGGFLLAGVSDSGVGGSKTNAPFGGEDVWIVRVDADGHELWQAAFGGGGDEDLFAAKALPDGGFLLAGTSDSAPGGNKTSANFGGADFWLVRVDANGHKLWDRSFGGTNEDVAFAMELAPGGGCLLAGYSLSGASGNKTNVNFGQSDGWLVRVDADGNKLWDAAFGGADYDAFTSLQPTADGGWLAGGWSCSGADGNKTSAQYGAHDYWLVRLDTDGIKQWDRAFGGSDDDALLTMAPTSAGGSLLAGLSGSEPGGRKTRRGFGQEDVWLVCVDTNGQPLWDYAFGGSDDDWPNALLATADGGFILAAETGSAPDGSKTTPCLGGGDFWLLRLTPTGAVPPTLRLVNPLRQGTNFCFSFQSQSGQSYMVEYNDDLRTTNWQFHHTITGDGSMRPCVVPMTNTAQRFFRVRQP